MYDRPLLKAGPMWCVLIKNVMEMRMSVLFKVFIQKASKYNTLSNVNAKYQAVNERLEFITALC